VSGYYIVYVKSLRYSYM